MQNNFFSFFADLTCPLLEWRCWNKFGRT